MFFFWLLLTLLAVFYTCHFYFGFFFLWLLLGAVLFSCWQRGLSIGEVFRNE